MSQCPYCWENAKGRTNHRGHAAYRKSPRKVREVGGAPVKIKRQAEEERLRESLAASVDETLNALFEALVSYMTETQYDDGSERQLPTLLVFVDEGLWKVCLNDRASERTAWSSGRTLEAAVSSLNEALESGCVEWRRSWAKRKGKS